jgi:Flp pilus assembly protein protease CpaA
MIWLAMALGILTSYTDIRQGKVKNVHLGIFAAISMALVIYSGDVGPPLINFAFSLAFGYFLWHLGIWTSGDAKLFSVYSLLVQISIYQVGAIPFFPSAAILVNTFVPLFLFYFFRLISDRKLERLRAMKSAFAPARLASTLVLVMALSWPLDALNHPLASNFFLRFLIVFLALSIIETRFDIALAAVIASAARLLLDSSVYSLPFILEMAMIVIIYAVTRILLLQLSFAAHSREVDIHLLRPGMVPAEEVYLDKDYRKRPLLHQSLFTLAKQGVFALRAEGLTEKDCQKLRKLKRDGGIRFDHLRVYQTLPFAAFLFIGVMLTYLARGNLFIYLRGLF